MYERPDGKWVAIISIGSYDARRRIKRVRDSEPAAREALRRLRAENFGACVDDERPPTLRALLERWLADTKPRVRAATWATYELTVRIHILEANPALVSMPIDRIRPAHVAAPLAQLAKAEVSPRMRELVYLRLRSALETTVGTVLRTNPALKAHRARVERRSMTTWTKAQARAFIESVRDDPLYALYPLALDRRAPRRAARATLARRRPCGETPLDHAHG